MPARRLQGPTAPAVTLADAKLALRIDGDELDPLITAWIFGIADHAEHTMGRAILTQTWRLLLERFPRAIALPMPPVTRVISISYLDADGFERTLPPERYVLDSAAEPAQILPALDAPWPATRNRHNAVRIDYTTGYGATAADTPEAIRLYLLAKLVEQFDPAVRPDRETVQSSYIDRLLDRYRIVEVG